MQLYSLAGGQTVSVARPTGAAPLAVGADRAELGSNCDEVHYCPTFSFVSIKTGEVRPDPTNAETAPDLNTDALARHVCAPLTVPAPELNAPTNRLQFDGKFILAYRAWRWVLERCGTRKRVSLNDAEADVPEVANEHAVVWIKNNRIVGRLLPSMGSFVVRDSPPHLVGVMLTSKALYALGSGRRLWRAPAPR